VKVVGNVLKRFAATDGFDNVTPGLQRKRMIFASWGGE